MRKPVYTESTVISSPWNVFKACPRNWIICQSKWKRKEKKIQSLMYSFNIIENSFSLNVLMIVLVLSEYLFTLLIKINSTKPKVIPTNCLKAHGVRTYTSMVLSCLNLTDVLQTHLDRCDVKNVPAWIPAAFTWW